MLKSVNKPKATWLAFATQEVTSNREKVSNILNTSDIIETRAAIAEKLKTFFKKIKKRKNWNNN